MTLKTALAGIATGLASAIILAGAAHAAPDNQRRDHDRSGYHRSPQPGHQSDTKRYDPRSPYGHRDAYYGQNTRYPGYKGSHGGYRHPGYPPQHPGNQNPRGGYGDLVVFEHGDFRGQSAPVTGNIARLNDIRFNDRISSIIVNRGTWEVCTDAYFRGRCYLVDRSVSNLGRMGINDKISSIRRVNGGHYGRR